MDKVIQLQITAQFKEGGCLDQLLHFPLFWRTEGQLLCSVNLRAKGTSSSSHCYPCCTTAGCQRREGCAFFSLIPHICCNRNKLRPLTITQDGEQRLLWRTGNAGVDRYPSAVPLSYSLAESNWPLHLPPSVRPFLAFLPLLLQNTIPCQCKIKFSFAYFAKKPSARSVHLTLFPLSTGRSCYQYSCCKQSQKWICLLFQFHLGSSLTWSMSSFLLFSSFWI